MVGTLFSHLSHETFTSAAEQHPDLERHGGCGGKGHAMNPALPVPSALSPAREVRLLQTTLGPQGQLGPLHWAKSCRGQPGNGARGGRSWMGNGARAEGELLALSGQPTNRKGHGRVPGYWDKGPARGRRGYRRSPSREARGGTAPGPPGTGRAPRHVPCGAGTLGAMQEHIGLVGQGGSQRSGKAGTDTR